MLSPAWFLSELVRHGAGCITGVPCSYASGLYAELEGGAWPYVAATAEGEAIALAAGAWLAGSQGVALCQNSGLGNMTNPLSSLVEPFRIPVILAVSRRGWPAGTDEPQHALMGAVTPELLELLRVTTEELSSAPGVASAQLEAAAGRCGRRRASALVVGKGVFGPATGAPRAIPGGGAPPAPTGTVQALHGGRRPLRVEVLAACLAAAGRRATVATTGYTARELYGLDDRDDHFYMVGSMGCAAAIGAGIACTGGRPVTVLDGDGALLMRMGALATVAQHVTTPFMHVVLDNGRHESTGGQRTNGTGVDFAAVARACGYRAVWRCDGLEAVEAGLRQAVAAPAGPVLVHCLVRPGAAATLPRPAEGLPDLALRFRTHMMRSAPATSPL